MSLRNLLPFLVLTVACFPIQSAAADWPVAIGPSNEPEPYVFSRDDLKKAPLYLNDYPAAFLRAATWFRIEANGTVECTTHEVIRLNNRKGIDQLGEHRNISFSPAYEKLTLNDARVHKADGRSVAIEAKNVQLRDTQTDYQVYSSTKELIISFPGLAVGDVIDVKWTTRGKNPEYAGQFFSRYQFGDEKLPIWRETFGVRIAKARTLKYVVTNPSWLDEKEREPIASEKDGFRTLAWNVQDRRPHPKEEHAPSKEELRPGVAISTFATWQDVAAWERTIRANCWESTAEMKKVVEQIRREHKKPETIARELTYWVRDNIRYVSTGDKHDFSPHAPVEVCRNRFGDCKDGVQLLSVLLKEAGIPSAFVSLSPEGDGQVDVDLPSPLTTHAILLVVIDGKEHWIDTTASHAGWDHLPKADRGRVCYAVDDKTIALMMTPKMTAADNRTEMVTRMKLDSSGTSENMRDLTFHGEAANLKRSEWVDVSATERRRLIRTDLLDSNSKISLSEIAIDEKALNRNHEPVRARIVFEVDQHLSGIGELDGSISDNLLWSRLLNATVDPERKLPLELKEPFESKHTFQIEAPLGYRLGVPSADRKYETNWGSFRRTIESTDAGRRWTVVFHTKLEKTRIDDGDYDAFVRFQERVQAEHRVSLTMKAVEGADVNIDIDELKRAYEKKPKDLEIALELAKLYLRADQKSEARRVLATARKEFPKERTILEMTAEAAEGPKEIAAAYQSLVRVFPAEAKYRLELVRRFVASTEYEKAGDLLTPLMTTGEPSEKAEALMLLARISLDKKDESTAWRRLKEAEAADAETVASVEGLCLRGAIQEARGFTSEALDAYRSALKIDVKDNAAFEGLIRVLIAADKKAEAVKQLRQYVARIEENGGKYGTAAEGFLKLGRLDDAAEMLEQTGPTEPAIKSLGMAYYVRGRWKDAIKHLSRFQPLQVDSLRPLIMSNLMLGNLNEAISWAIEKRQFEKLPADLEPLLAAVAKMRFTKLRLDMQSAPQQDPTAVDQAICADYFYSIGLPVEIVERLLPKEDIGHAAPLRAILLLDKGQLSKASIEAEFAIRSIPKDARGWYVRGRVYLERDKLDAAHSDLNKAVELSGSTNGRILHWYATVLLNKKRFHEAEATQLLAAKLLPADAEIKEQLDLIRAMNAKK